jgi:hypothetical protein
VRPVNRGLDAVGSVVTGLGLFKARPAITLHWATTPQVIAARAQSQATPRLVERRLSGIERETEAPLILIPGWLRSRDEVPAVFGNNYSELPDLVAEPRSDNCGPPGAHKGMVEKR